VLSRHDLLTATNRGTSALSFVPYNAHSNHTLPLNHPLHLLLVTFEIRVSPVLMYRFSLFGIFFMFARIGASPRHTLSLSPPPGGTDRTGFCRRTAIALCCVGVRCDGSTDVTFVMLHLLTILPQPTVVSPSVPLRRRIIGGVPQDDAIKMNNVEPEVVQYVIYTGSRLLGQVAVGAGGR
jgi:hypothetical protein